MNLRDLSASGGLQPLLAFHRRTERHLARLAALASELESGGIAPHACGTAWAILRELGFSSAQQHVLEETRLLPAIERRLRQPRALAEFRETRALIAHEHDRIARAWRPIRRPLEALAEGLMRPLDHDAIAAFRALYTRHIVTEEAALFRILQPARGFPVQACA